MSTLQVWKSTNRLLDALPADTCERLHKHLQRVPLPAGKVLYESSLQQSCIYFPAAAWCRCCT